VLPFDDHGTLAFGVRERERASPGWVAESLADLGLDPAEGTPAATVARAYVDAVDADAQGAVLRPR
jgi:hypothetical protein